jgi:hypothetical protein
MSRESTVTRRAAILSTAGAAMDNAHRRRTRNARIASAAAILAFAFTTAILFSRTPRPADQLRPLAIDFQSIHATTASVDFAIVRETTVPLLDTLTDAEAEVALEEAGYCVRLLRMGTTTKLVDCSSGMPAIIR